MTKLVFETASIKEAVKRASRVAPTKGSSFDKSAGIVLDIDISPMMPPSVAIKATNTDVYFTEWVDPLDASGDSIAWRFPSRLLAGLIESLPVGPGKEIVMEEKAGEEGRIVHVTSGRTRAKFYLMNTENYPTWMPFDNANLTKINDLGGRLSMVAWAAAETEEKINGVHLDGTHVMATDRYRLVKAPLAFDSSQPVTIPAAILAPLLKETGEIKVGVEGDMFLIEPDEFTQIKTIISGHEYPNLSRVMRTDYPQMAHLKKAELLEVMARSLTFTGPDRFPLMRLFFGKEEINIFMEDAERGLLGDAVELPGQMQHDRCELKFTPKNIMEGLDNAPNPEIILGYDPDKPDMPLYINGGSGYECWVMPRRDTADRQGPK